LPLQLKANTVAARTISALNARTMDGGSVHGSAASVLI
jgi:hypothetical protein